MKALDLSFSAASLSWCQAQKAAGWDLLVVNLWTGASSPSPARANLANARQAGMLTAGYTVVNNLSGNTAINKAATAAGPEWAHLAFVSVDVEVATTAAIVREAVNGLRAQGKLVCIYTGGWFWNSFTLAGQDFGDVPCWLADYDGNPALDTAPLTKLGPVIGKQYRNSHNLGGVTVDANTFDDSFIQEVEMTPEQLALLMALKEAMFGGGAPDGADRISAVDRKVEEVKVRVAALEAAPGGRHSHQLSATVTGMTEEA